MLDDYMDEALITDFKCLRLKDIIIVYTLTIISNNSCSKYGATQQSLPTSTPRNLFIHVTKTDAGLVCYTVYMLI